ncbi:BTB/POZ domain-containing protein At3g44820 isoform X1 [Sesamum indicum]|uniref:BTB/POZ domain-containing protein At3g44820 isoform X1 n=1 Tax=Sesamum indicum TaxID=4182 RepID=A0A6I9TY39_SESIN|nr:BTB/POZ domain-containing protein At3g44820 isoform X1 [Sesamum indicum]XP_011088825.1 BTB/POZ domain-containing protein At3g44820 isoform X1 [Sesamum indicum]
MAPAGKISEFHRDENDWFCNASLPSDITLVVDGMYFHLHKFPLISRCGRIANIVKESRSTIDKTFKVLEEFPGGADTFFMIVKFCYSGQVEFTPKNVVMLYCAADYLDMTDDYGEDNLLSRAESFFHKHILRQWKDCILALQNCEPVIPRADKLQIISRCLNALSVMVCTDRSLFGWPMMMYGRMQSPGGSILWNGINTGARIDTSESDWWFEDISCLCIELFEKLIQTMAAKGIRPRNLTRAIMYYCKKYLPGLDRRQGGQTGVSTKVVSFSTAPAAIDEGALLQRVVKFLPEKKGKSFCRFLLGLLRVALILGINHTYQDLLEKKIGIQLELATLDGIIIPSYSDSDTLYNTDCVERMIHHFVHSEPSVTSISPISLDLETSPSSERLKRVGKLVDNYIAEVASDVNLKPGKVRSLAEALPESSRSLHDGLYRALDIYFKAHPWLLEKEREQMCTIIDFQKLSIDACAHASQNKRLPLRVILQILFFEQLQLRTSLAGCLHALDAESAPAASATATNEITDQIAQRGGWVTVIHENQVLKVDMARMRSRVGELEEEFSKIKEEMKKVKKSHSYHSSPRFVTGGLGCKLLPRSSDAQSGLVESSVATPRALVEQAQPSTSHAPHRHSLSSF